MPVSTFFAGRNRLRGHGWGSTFANWLRTNVVPLLKTGAKYLGKQLISGTSAAATDILEGTKPSDAFKTRIKEVGKDVFTTAKKKLTGRGKKRKVKRGKKKGKRKKTTHKSVF